MSVAPDREQPAPPETPWGIVASLGLLAVGLAAGAVFWNARQAARLWSDAGTTISAVADLKLAQVEMWRVERLADGQTIRESPNTVRGLESFVAAGQRIAPVDAARLRQWMRALARRNGYARVALIDSAARVVLANDDGRPLDEETRRAALNTMAVGGVLMGEIHRAGADSAARLDLVAALPSSRPGGASFGAVVLSVDPRAVLLPLVESWPNASRTGEVLLLSLADSVFTFLSDTRWRHGSSLTLRRRMSEYRPEVRDAMARGGGLVVQEDYRGVPVFAATRRVPGSSWVLTAKLDVAEIRGPQRQRAVLLVSLVALFTLGCGFGVVAIWRQRAARHFRQLYEAETERRAVTRHYEHLTRHANDMIMLADGEGRIIEANDRAIAEFGYSRDELLGLRIADLRAPGYPAEDAASLVAEVGERGGAVYETVHRRKDGSTMPVEVSARVIEIEGRPYLQGIVRDVSERKRQERRIADLNRIYAVLSEINQAIVRTRDRDELLKEICRISVEVGSFRLAWVGKVQGDEILPVAYAGAAEGYIEDLKVSVRDEPLGRGPTGRAAREGRTATSDDIASDPAMAPWRDVALAHGFRANAALPLSMHGRVIGVLSLHSGAPQFFDAQELKLLDEVAADISYALEGLEREEQRQRAEAERARLVAAIEQASDMVVITDLAGAVQYVNHAFERITGYSRAEVLGRDPRPLPAGPQEEALHRAVKDTVSGGHTWRGRLTSYRKDGTPLEEETTVSPIRDASGAVISVVAVARDVTREAALESQLRQAQKMEEMGRLAGGVAHDFNNILTAIIGSAELVLADLPPEAGVAPDVRNIHRAARRGADLTQKLLSFSRRRQLSVRAVEVGQLVVEFAQLVRRILREDISLVVAAEAPGPSVVADPGAIEQILMNLVTNARDAMAERGTIVLDVGVTELGQDDCDLLRAGSPGEYVVLTVSDNGNGMDQATQQRLFEPFFTTKELGAGTGLGMSMVYRLVQEHKGFVAVDSAVGQGTTVRVYLPARGSAVAEPADTASASPQRGTETVLVVEDEDDLRAFARRALEKYGYCVLTASDGLDALDVLRSRGDAVALVVSDMVMPRMGGPQLEKAMRQAGFDMPVVFTSGYPARTADEARLREGPVRFLAKPWTISELLRLVREALDDTRP